MPDCCLQYQCYVETYPNVYSVYETFTNTYLNVIPTFVDKDFIATELNQTHKILISDNHRYGSDMCIGLHEKSRTFE